jgi:hypothetical protein
MSANFELEDHVHLILWFNLQYFLNIHLWGWGAGGLWGNLSKASQLPL